METESDKGQTKERKIVRLSYMKNNYKASIPTKFIKVLGWEKGDYIKVWVDGDTVCMKRVEE